MGAKYRIVGVGNYTRTVARPGANGGRCGHCGRHGEIVNVARWLCRKCDRREQKGRK